MNRDHSVVRHAYENVLNASTRLAAFASSKPTNSLDSLIDIRQGILVTDDLMTFAISARRLIHNTTSSEKFAAHFIILGGVDKKIPITRIINIIVHHRFIEIIRRSSQVRYMIGNWELDGLLSKNLDYASQTEYFSPIIGVESDKDKISFNLWDFITKFELHVLAPIVDFCADNYLFLEDILND